MKEWAPVSVSSESCLKFTLFTTDKKASYQFHQTRTEGTPSLIDVVVVVGVVVVVVIVVVVVVVVVVAVVVVVIVVVVVVVVENANDVLLF